MTNKTFGVDMFLLILGRIQIILKKSAYKKTLGDKFN